MYKIATLNKISPVGLAKLSDKYSLTDNIAEAHGVLVRSHDMHSMDFSDDLMVIARAGAGVNNIPIAKCSEKGIVVFNTPGANANAVKELVLAGMLLSARNIPEALEWSQTLKDVPVDDVPALVEKAKAQFAGKELKGKVLGVIGLGSIGVLVANSATRLGMKVMGYDPFITVSSAHELDHKVPVVNNLSTLLPHCDYISIHIPAINDTKDMINSKRFDEMKAGVVFLNFSRGELVNDDNLIGALKSKKVKKYITDFPNGKLAGREGVVMIPHLGASTSEAEDNCAIMATEQMMDYIENGNIQRSVNLPECTLGVFKKGVHARICIMNKNVPSILGKITSTMAELNINIANMNNRSKGDYAYTLLDIDSDVDEAQLKKSMKVEGVINVRVIK